MKLINLLLAFCLAVTVYAWSPEDYEIFELNEKIRSDLGQDINFYSWLDLKKGPKSTFDDINKAYRKLSRKMHPDKIKDRKLRKKAEDRFQRLSLVGQVLRSEKRQRYDFFLKNGFPKWKDTGYYYSKFRPGLGSVLFLLYLIVGGFQYIGVKINRRQDRIRLAGLISQIKQQAWHNGVPPKDFSDRKISNQETGKNFVVKFDGSVYLIDQENSNDLVLLDPQDIEDPYFKENIIYKFPISIWNKSVGRLLPDWIVDTTIKPIEPKTSTEHSPSEEESKKALPKKPKGEKIELPNGKVIYGRSNAGKRKK